MNDVREHLTTAALQHPHIIPLFDSGSADGFLYYVMPFIDGETLRVKLDRQTQLGVDEAVRIARVRPVRRSGHSGELLRGAARTGASPMSDIADVRIGMAEAPATVGDSTHADVRDHAHDTQPAHTAHGARTNA